MDPWYDDRYDWDPLDFTEDPYLDFSEDEISLYATDPEQAAL